MNCPPTIPCSSAALPLFDLAVLIVVIVLAYVVQLYLVSQRPPRTIEPTPASPYNFGRKLCHKKRRNLHHIDPYVDMLIRLSLETAQRMADSTSSDGDELLQEINYCTRREIKLFTTTMMGCTGHSLFPCIRALTVSKAELFEQIRRAYTTESVKQIYLSVREINRTVRAICAE